VSENEAAQSPEYRRAERRMRLMLVVEMWARSLLDTLRDFCNSAWGSLSPETERAVERWVRGDADLDE